MELEREAVSVVSEETKIAQEHNAQISERYYKLQNEIEDQFAKQTQNTVYNSAATYAQPKTYFAPTFSDSSTMQQRPSVTEYVRADVMDSSLFTTDKFEKFQTKTPSFTQTNYEVAQVASVVTEESYGLTPFAKMIMAAFTFVVVTMLTLACVNTQIIHRKNIRLQNLEEKRQELIEKNEEIQRRIEKATSDEVIQGYAQENGMVIVGE